MPVGVAGSIAPLRVRHIGVFGQTVSAVRHASEIPVLAVRSYGRERAQRSNHAVELKFEPE